MSKIKKTLITLISLCATLFLILGLSFGLARASAFANAYSPTSIFSAGVGGTVDASSAEGDKFVEFSFTAEGKVHFRRDLALKWFSKNEDGTVTAKYFSVQFAFGEVNFETFTIDFESEEENISKDGKAKNSITFEVNATDDTKLDVFVNKPEAKAEGTGNAAGAVAAVSVLKNEDIFVTIAESEDCNSGEFDVIVKNVLPAAQDGATTNTEIAGKFENVGGYFMEYRSSSSSTPNTPITFTATKLLEGKEKQTLLMKSLNGQSFLLDANGKVTDNAPAVLVLNEEVYAFKLGQKFSLTYKALDVCDDNVSVSREYYMLKSKKEETSPEVFYMPNETSLTGEENKQYEPYNYKTLSSSSTYFLPSQEKEEAVEYVAIRFKLDDETDANDTYVYLSWYAATNAVQTFACTGYEEQEVTTGEGETATTKKEVQSVTGDFDFIKVDRAQKAPVYKYLTADEATSANVKETGYDDAVTAYQELLDEAAGKASAGTGSYIYLPSLRDLIDCESEGYRNLKFSIYYYGPRQGEGASATSQTSLKYNALRFEVPSDGEYKFRVFAKDASDNGMQYYQNGQLVTVTSSNIWEIENIPEFKFTIKYTGPTIEKTTEQSLGYKNDTYTFGSFSVVATSGYDTKYTLYRYNAANVPEGIGAPTSYSTFVEKAADYVKAFKEHDDGVTDPSQKILREIGVYQKDVTEKDEAKWNRTDNAYYWNPDDALSFVPQEDGFYILKLLVEDKDLLGETAEAFQVIEVRNPIDTIPGQSKWLEENVVSVVLFAISGVLAIVVVVLFLVKPSDKKLEEVDLEKLKGKKKNKN